MRNIKFRARDNVDGKFIDLNIFHKNLFINCNGDVFWYSHSGIEDANHRIDIQFCTGLTDKNGVDIYERDLLKNKSGRICEVVWNKYCATFDTEVRVTKDRCDSLGFKNSQWNRSIEKIGNIHENYDLLEATK